MQSSAVTCDAVSCDAPHAAVEPRGEGTVLVAAPAQRGVIGRERPERESDAVESVGRAAETADPVRRERDERERTGLASRREPGRAERYNSEIQ